MEEKRQIYKEETTNFNTGNYTDIFAVVAIVGYVVVVVAPHSCSHTPILKLKPLRLLILSILILRKWYKKAKYLGLLTYDQRLKITYHGLFTLLRELIF